PQGRAHLQGHRQSEHDDGEQQLRCELVSHRSLRRGQNARFAGASCRIVTCTRAAGAVVPAPGMPLYSAGRHAHPSAARWRNGEPSMHLTPREQEKLLIYTLADVALRRKAKGLKLNHPESVAVISAAAMEGAREGKTVEQVMKDAAGVLTQDDVMT